MTRANGLARFRADPEKVRVSVVRERGKWRAVVHLRADCSRYATALDSDPAEAVDAALGKAADAEMPGVDPDMQWAYRHPWWRQEP